MNSFEDSFRMLCLILFAITEEGLKVSARILKEAMWKVKTECHQLGLYLGRKKQIVEMLFQKTKEA